VYYFLVLFLCNAITGDDGPLQLACEAARVKLHAMSGSSSDLTAMAEIAAGEKGGAGAAAGSGEEDIDAAVCRVCACCLWGLVGSTMITFTVWSA